MKNRLIALTALMGVLGGPSPYTPRVPHLPKAKLG